MDGHLRGTQIKIDLEKSRDRERKEIFSTRFFNRTGLLSRYLHFVRDIAWHVLFFHHGFLWKQGARVGKETPRGWRMFCNFSGLLVSRAVLLIETKFSPPWLIGRIRFFPFQIARISQVFSFFFFFFFFFFFRYDKYRIDFQVIRYLRRYKWWKRIFLREGIFRYFYAENLYPRGFDCGNLRKGRDRQDFYKTRRSTTVFQIEIV